MRRIPTYFFTVAVLLLAGAAAAQKTDTLPGVRIYGKKKLPVTLSTTPLQQMDKSSLGRLNSLSVADAIKYFPGVVVKDYGGIGGLKTISVRSLSANHTGVMYDGIVLGDAQGGQIDLGRFSLDNIDNIQLYYNQPTDLLLPARTFASAAVLSLNTNVPNNNETPTSVELKIKTGSFGFINPTISYKRNYRSFGHGLNIEYQNAHGKYSFIDYETGRSKKERINSDIETYRLEYDAYLGSSDTNRLKLKLYYYDSKRGLPGSVILYNSISKERLNTQNFFAQISWRKQLTNRSRLALNGKFSTDDRNYLDPSYPNSAGKLENNFKQKEYYLSGSYQYTIVKGLLVAYASDVMINRLKRTDAFTINFANPDRLTYLNNLALQYKNSRLEINSNLLLTNIREAVDSGNVANNLNRFAPAFSASYQPILYLPMRLRVSFKDIFRAPTFDDLYFTNIGNTNLRPEIAKQINAGITYNGTSDHFIRSFVFTADAYYNRVTDKILAVPRFNLFQWSMLNIGKVETKGIDISGQFAFAKWNKMQINPGLTYSFQDARDMSDKTSAQFNAQLPYTPKHSGSFNLNINIEHLDINYNLLSSSFRYRRGEPTPENVVNGWTTHDISASYHFSSFKYWNYKLLVELNNVVDRQYEIIRFYPMPRFNYRIGIIASLKNKNKTTK